MPLKLLAINCTLKPSTGKEASSSDVMIDQLLKAFRKLGVKTEKVRAADYTIKPGVSVDEGDGDAWPAIRKKLMAADILLLGTPIWLGQPSSVCKRVLERINAFLEETDSKGRMVTFGKVACVCVVGNEDGAHHVSAETFQALNDLGFSIPAGGVAYWVGEAMGSVDFKDLKLTPAKVSDAIETTARNAAHLAKILKAEEYPGKN